MLELPSLWQVAQVVYVAVSLPILCNLTLNTILRLRLRRQLFNVYLQQTNKRASARAWRKQRAVGGMRGDDCDGTACSGTGLASAAAAVIAARLGATPAASRSSASATSSAESSDTETQVGGGSLALLERLIRQYFGDKPEAEAMTEHQLGSDSSNMSDSDNDNEDDDAHDIVRE